MRKIEGYTITDDYQVIGLRGKVLKGTRTDKGYTLFNNHKQGHLLHVLIARAYPEICGEWFDGAVVHHKDRNKDNNDPHNLIVLTKEEHDEIHKNDRGFKKGSEPWNKGKTFNEDSKKRMSESAIKRGATYKKKVVQMKDGKVIKVWDCAMDVYKETGISYKAISACCHNNQVHAGGYEWRFAKDN